VRRTAAAAAVIVALAVAAGATAGGRQESLPRMIVPVLGGGDSVFPVVGTQAGPVDNFGAGRADVLYHHGDDIFAPEGTPVVAVADGTLSLVGDNPLGGLRLWLRDRQGNEFYYAHLEGFARRARDGARVSAGELLGYVGHTGDAETTPPHLHFEVHPASLISLGYDGAVDPWPYLRSWRRLDAPLPATAVAPAPAPVPGSAAVLLAVRDISSASGLVPGSLERVARR
jgi:murein DD-endopeptidase MepM/ murein hydrolase activator NlpD